MFCDTFFLRKIIESVHSDYKKFHYSRLCQLISHEHYDQNFAEVCFENAPRRTGATTFLNCLIAAVACRSKEEILYYGSPNNNQKQFLFDLITKIGVRVKVFTSSRIVLDNGSVIWFSTQGQRISGIRATQIFIDNCFNPQKTHDIISEVFYILKPNGVIYHF